MLKETQRNAKRIRYESKLLSIPICYDGELSVICKHCGFFIACLSVASHFLTVDLQNYRFGNHFLLFQRLHYDSLRIEGDNQIFNTEQPFLLMYLKPVSCDYCGESLGLFFQTCNILGTRLLLGRIALNMENLELSHKHSHLMESTINLLLAQLTLAEQQKREKQEDKQMREHTQKKQNIQHEKYIADIIKHYTHNNFQQNTHKKQLASNIINQLSVFDRRTQRLQKQYGQIITNAQALKTRIVSKYSSIQNFKMQLTKPRPSPKK